MCLTSTIPLINNTKYGLCHRTKINYFYLLIIFGFILFNCFLSTYFNLHKKLWFYLRNIRCKSCKDNENDSMKNSSETFMQRIQYNELVLATDNWNKNRIIGEGGFGIVYKGNWIHTDVAIKRLKNEVRTHCLKKPSSSLIRYKNRIFNFRE